MFSWQHNPLVLSHPVWSVIPFGHIQHQLKYWDKALDPFIVWVNRCVAWWRITDQSVDNWQILLWDYRHCCFTLISENEMRIEENHHWILYIYIFVFFEPLRLGKRSGEVMRTTALGKCSKKTKKQKNIPVCVTLGCIFPSCRPLRDKSAEIPAQPFEVLLCVMMATAALCMAGKSPLVHVFVSAPPCYPFFPSTPPPLFSLISSSSSPLPSDPSGRLPVSLGTSLEDFF